MFGAPSLETFFTVCGLTSADFQYEVVNPRTPQTPFACLRVVGDESSTVILSLELSVDIWLHSSMCDGLVAAVVLMLKTHDAWLDLSGGSLVVRDEGGKSSTIGTSTVK